MCLLLDDFIFLTPEVWVYLLNTHLPQPLKNRPSLATLLCFLNRLFPVFSDPGPVLTLNQPFLIYESLDQITFWIIAQMQKMSPEFSENMLLMTTLYMLWFIIEQIYIWIVY